MNLFPLGYISGLVELPSVGAAPSPLKTYTGPGMLSFAGKLLDATGRYMFVFIIAGIEVTTSALVLALGNFFCIKKKSDEPQTNEAAAEREELNKSEEKAPEDAKVDSVEVEQFLKDEPEKNGEVVTNPETCV